MELYAKTPRERHHEIVVSGGRLYFDGEEYVINAQGEHRLIHSNRRLEERLAQIGKKLSIE
ncbi:hypothetical protein ACFLUU_08910 [Chloroflexota bacterium]